MALGRFVMTKKMTFLIKINEAFVTILGTGQSGRTAKHGSLTSGPFLFVASKLETNRYTLATH